MAYALLTLAYAISVLSIVALGTVIVRGGRPSPARGTLAVFIGGTVVWAAQALWSVHAAPDDPASLVAWTMPVAALVIAHVRGLVHQLCDPAWRANPRVVITFGAHTAVTVVVAAVPALHPLVVSLDDNGDATFGVLFWLHVAVGYLFLARSLTELVNARRHLPALAQRSLVEVVLAWSLPLAANLMSTFFIGPRGPDITPLGLSITAIVLWRAIVLHGLADLMPIATTQVFEHLVDAVFVTDARHRLIDANAKARDLAGLEPGLGRARGLRLSDICPTLGEVSHSPGEHDVQLNGQYVVLDIAVTPLRDRGLGHIGFVIHSRDITVAALRQREFARIHAALADEADSNEKLRVELADQAVHDQGTGLHNRRYVMDNLPAIVTQCEEGGVPLSIALLDLDRFKSVNDTHGHSVGDRVLAAVATAMAAQAPPGAMARFGGEEFIVLLPGLDSAQAEACADTMRSACAEVRVRTREGTIQVTVSAGVATSTSERIDAYALIDAADAALYRAKDADRNQTWVSGSD